MTSQPLDADSRAAIADYHSLSLLHNSKSINSQWVVEEKFRMISPSSPDVNTPNTPSTNAYYQIPQARLVTVRWLVRSTLQLEGQYRRHWRRRPRNYCHGFQCQRRPRTPQQDARVRQILP